MGFANGKKNERCRKVSAKSFKGGERGTHRFRTMEEAGKVNYVRIITEKQIAIKSRRYQWGL